MSHYATEVCKCPKWGLLNKCKFLIIRKLNANFFAVFIENAYL